MIKFVMLLCTIVTCQLFGEQQTSIRDVPGVNNEACQGCQKVKRTKITRTKKPKFL